jgi:predicted DsbA family dithiol-disulfide isomerase
MRVDIISDTICPWCYVGKRRFERALAASRLERGPVEVVWWPFQLNPSMPAEGMERAAYLTERFGAPERATEIYRQVEAAGRDEGIPFAFDRIGTTPNTMNSHRLIAYAGVAGRQNDMVEVLFRRYFEHGENIGALDVLVDSAIEAGLEGQAVRTFLESEAARDDIARGDIAARRLGIGGVPCFIINARYAISGAQAPEVFQRVFSLGDDEAGAEAAPSQA